MRQTIGTRKSPGEKIVILTQPLLDAVAFALHGFRGLDLGNPLYVLLFELVSTTRLSRKYGQHCIILHNISYFENTTNTFLIEFRRHSTVVIAKFEE
jgi:hypothetical protein